MSYRNFLGEFIATDRDDWPKTIKYVERRPFTGPGGNPWEAERQRRVWLQENDAWTKIQTLKREYISIEKKMSEDISIYNSHLKEFQRVTKTKAGLGPIGTYTTMALAIIPGTGWVTALITGVEMLLQMTQGNILKKRIKQLQSIMIEAIERLERGKIRLGEIQHEMHALMGTTERAKAENDAIVARDTANQAIVAQAKASREQFAFNARKDEIALIRQRNPFKVHYASDL